MYPFNREFPHIRNNVNVGKQGLGLVGTIPVQINKKKCVYGKCTFAEVCQLIMLQVTSMAVELNILYK